MTPTVPLNRDAGRVKRKEPTGPTLQQRMVNAFSAGGAALFVVLALTGWSVSRLLDARAHLEDRLDPAALAVRDLHDILLDEASLVLAGATEPAYREVDARRPALEREATGGLSGDSDLAKRLAAFLDTATAWRANAAEPALAGRGDPDEVRDDPAFAAVSESFERLRTGVDDARQQAVGDVDTSTTVAELAVAVSFAVFVGLGGVLWVGLGRYVLEPLEQLGEDTQEIIEGNLGHQVQRIGPPEIAQLGFDIEAMRDRIATELDAVMEARTQAEAGAAELARSNAELEQFAYVASHDLQEPLRKIASFCQLIEQRYGEQLDERGKQYIDFAVEGAKRMQRLINDLLAFSRVGRSGEGLEPILLEDEVTEALRVMAKPMREAGAKVEVGPLPPVLGERSLLGVVLQNLLSNAVRFKGPDPPRIAISAAACGEGWEIAVADNGIGIEPKFAERVFILFQRVQGRDSYEGTGIGLAMCRKIVTFHGGRIWVDTAVKSGTTIRFTLRQPAPAVAPP